MRLGDYLIQEKLSYAEFGALIGRPAATIHRYAKGQRDPDGQTKVEIYLATRGQVRPDDYYDLPPLPDQEGQAA